MPLVNTKEMFEKAMKGKYSIAHFNVSNIEQFDTFLEAAQEINAPIIIAFTTGLIKYYGMEYLEGLSMAASKKYKIPFAIHLDHHKEPSDIFDKIQKNKYITSVMIDASLEEYEKNVKLSKEVVDHCKKMNISVEAELGAMKGQEDEHHSDDFFYTDPELAQDFIKKTGIDSLAISIGTVHGCVSKLAPTLDLSRLRTLRKNTNIPLVLHGASGISDEQIKQVVEAGITKINVATELKVVFFQALKKYNSENPKDNDSRNYFTAANRAVKDVIIHKIKLFGSANKA